MTLGRLMLSTAIIGLLVSSSGLASPSSSTASTLGNGRCNAPPCTCDQYGRLTCDCKDSSEELYLSSEGEWGLSRHTSRIVVTNCASVQLANHSLAQMDGLLSIDLLDVANLSLSRHSFKLSSKASKARITVRNSSLDLLPSNVFHGDVEAIVLDQTHIARVAAFAFANLLNTNSITLENCQIDNIEALAFKRFDVRFLHVIGGTLGGERVPSRAMSDVEVTDKFMLDGVTMGAVASSAFIVRRPKTVAILNCAIRDLESEAFDISASGTVIIKNNTLEHVGFGAFLSIRSSDLDSSKQQQPHSLMFKDNNVTGFEEGSLLFDRASFRVELANVLVNRACDCEPIALWRSQILNYTNAYSRMMTSREGTTSVVAPSAYTLESSVDEPDTFLCLDDPDIKSVISFDKYENRHCALSGSMLLLIVVLSALILVLILAGCASVYCCKRRRRDSQKRWISVPTTAPDIVSAKMARNGHALNHHPSTTSGIGTIHNNGGGGGGGGGSGPVDSRITMVVPDGRLYRETEFHVIVEKAEPLTTEL